MFHSSAAKRALLTPKTDFGGRSEYRGLNEQGFHYWVYDTAKESPFNDVQKLLMYETKDDLSFQRWTKEDAQVDENGKTGGVIEQFLKLPIANGVK